MPKAIEIRNFSYSYADGTHALSKITLEIEHGEKIALIGPNGAGKSTLLLAIGGFLQGAGHILIDGLEVKKKNLKKIRGVIGCCFEDPDDQLFMPTLFDDVAFGPLNMGLEHKQVEDRVFEALRVVGLDEMSHKPPHHLSAGQKRAASVATILAMNPKIITFDEPDGSLDGRHRGNLVRLLKGLSQTLIIATCNMSFAAAVAQRAVLIDNGKMVVNGSSEKILSDYNLMREHGLEAVDKI